MGQKISDDEIEQVLARSMDSAMEGEGKIIGKKAQNFALLDQASQLVTLSEAYKTGPVLLAFYPADFTVVCTKQLCNYRDNIIEFYDLGMTILGISSNSVAEHFAFAEQYHFPFRILSDMNNNVARAYGCTSIWMMGKLSRAVFIVNSAGVILYRYVEPTIITKRSASELLTVATELRKLRLI